jgi:glycosyltransferase involved in cell wall biosynthesis
MHILYVCPYYKPAYVYGGPVQSFSDSCEGLVESGAQVTVFTTNANGSTLLDVPLQRSIVVEGVTVWYFPLALKGLSFFYSPALAEAVRARVSEFDLVVAAALWGHALIPTASACSRACVPYVIPTHGQLFPWALAKKRLKKMIYLELFARRYVNRAAAIHCTDPSEAEAVSQLMFRPPTFVVPNAIHTAFFTTRLTRGNLRKQFGISDRAYLLIFLGRITRIKRPDVAVDVLGATQRLDREVHLVIVGPDEDGLTRQLQAQAQRLGCHDKLHFTGLLDREGVASALADANLLLMPSEIVENFGLSAVEAMAAGVPVLASDGVPTGRWAQMAGAGRITACTSEGFQQAAIELLSKPELLQIMSRRGQELARDRFDVSAVAHEMLAQYEAIVEIGHSLPETDYDLKIL